MQTSSYLPTKVTKQLDKFFDKSIITRLAKSCGFVLRKVQKITAYHFVLGFLLCCAKGKNTLQEWARQISLLSGKSVRKQSLWERFHQGTEIFAESLLKKLMLKRAFYKLKSSVFQAFTRVVLQDSTTLRLPDSLSKDFPGSTVRGVQRACARIQTVIEVKAMGFLHFALGAYTQNDYSASDSIMEVVRPGDLLLRDMGYFSQKVFIRLKEAGSHFLSRLRFGVKLYDYYGRELVYFGKSEPAFRRKQAS